MWEEGVRIYGTPGVPNNFPKVCYAKLPILVKVYIGKNPITLSSESSKVMAEDLT